MHVFFGSNKEILNSAQFVLSLLEIQLESASKRLKEKEKVGAETFDTDTARDTSILSALFRTVLFVDLEEIKKSIFDNLTKKSQPYKGNLDELYECCLRLFVCYHVKEIAMSETLIGDKKAYIEKFMKMLDGVTKDDELKENLKGYALNLAVYLKSPELVEIFSKGGYPIDKVGKEYLYSSVLSAIRNKRFDILSSISSIIDNKDILSAIGASRSDITDSLKINYSYLPSNFSSKSFECLEILLETIKDWDRKGLFKRGSELINFLEERKKEGTGGGSALHYAVRTKNVPLAKALLEAHANPNLAAISSGDLPLFSAITNPSKEMVALLLEKGADISKCCYGMTAFKYATLKAKENPNEDQSEVLQIFLERSELSDQKELLIDLDKEQRCFLRDFIKDNTPTNQHKELLHCILISMEAPTSDISGEIEKTGGFFSMFL